MTARNLSIKPKFKGLSAQSKSVISPDGDSAYKVDIESQQNRQTTREVLVARRIGDC